MLRVYKQEASNPETSDDIIKALETETDIPESIKTVLDMHPDYTIFAAFASLLGDNEVGKNHVIRLISFSDIEHFDCLDKVIHSYFIDNARKQELLEVFQERKEQKTCEIKDVLASLELEHLDEVKNYINDKLSKYSSVRKELLRLVEEREKELQPKKKGWFRFNFSFSRKAA